MPRWIDVERVTFKYGLGDDFINVLKTLQKLDLVQTDPVEVRGVKVSPRDVVAAALPDPAELGDKMHGRTCAGTWVQGDRQGRRATRGVRVPHRRQRLVDEGVRSPGGGVADGGDAGRGDRADGAPALWSARSAWSDRRRCRPSRSSTCSTSTAWSGTSPTTTSTAPPPQPIRPNVATACRGLTADTIGQAGEAAGVGEGVGRASR